MKQLQIDVFSNNQVWLSSPLLYTIIAIHSVMNKDMKFCTMKNLDRDYHTTFSRWEKLEIFWMGNPRKCLVAPRHFLDKKWQKTPSSHQVFPYSKMVQNAWQPPSIFQMGNPKKCLMTTKRFLDEIFQKTPSDHQAIFGLKILENTQWLFGIFWIRSPRKHLVAIKHFLDKKWQKMPSDRQAFFGWKIFKNVW